VQCGRQPGCSHCSFLPYQPQWCYAINLRVTDRPASEPHHAHHAARSTGAGHAVAAAAACCRYSASWGLGRPASLARRCLLQRAVAVSSRHFVLAAQQHREPEPGACRASA
jgi:hypothetical protein